MDEMHGFAQAWRNDHRGQGFTRSKLSGFCLLIKREVYETIGGLDERFGLGLFDDDDLAERARRAGFGLGVAHDLFVHHFGSRTFVGNGIDAEGLLDDNARRFAAKWGLSGTNGRRFGYSPHASRSASPREGDPPWRTCEPRAGRKHRTAPPGIRRSAAGGVAYRLAQRLALPGRGAASGAKPHTGAAVKDPPEASLPARFAGSAGNAGHILPRPQHIQAQKHLLSTCVILK